jgi:phage protein
VNGYHIEKEKRYLVKAKGVYLNSCLIFDKGNKKWFFSSIYELDHQRGHHTRKELEEAGFEEVFNSPLFEVEEVD